MKLVQWTFVACVSAALSLANASLPGFDSSPPGIVWSYFKMDKVTSAKKYDSSRTWYTTASHSFLLPTFKTDDDYTFITISTFEKWYCVAGFPTYCAPLDGLDGVMLTNPKGHVWPRSKD